MISIDFVIPAFHSKDLLECAISSFERFSGGFNFRYIVVENSSDDSYKEFAESLGNVLWVQNNTKHIGSEANAIAIDVGSKFVDTEFAFICHVDTMACHSGWMDFIYNKAVQNGYSMVGFREDAQRVNAIHQAGILIRSDVLKSVSSFPVYDGGKMVMDVGDSFTVYCRDNGLKYFCCDNTFNNKELVDKVDVFNGILIDRAVDDDCNVIFMHLGRGIVKLHGGYNKPNRIGYMAWLDYGKTLTGRDI